MRVGYPAPPGAVPGTQVEASVNGGVMTDAEVVTFGGELYVVGDVHLARLSGLRDSTFLSDKIEVRVVESSESAQFENEYRPHHRLNSDQIESSEATKADLDLVEEDLTGGIDDLAEQLGASHRVLEHDLESGFDAIAKDVETQLSAIRLKFATGVAELESAPGDKPSAEVSGRRSRRREAAALVASHITGVHGDDDVSISRPAQGERPLPVFTGERNATLKISGFAPDL